MPNLVILTGAGVSAESGVPTFRASDGLWENHRIEDVASPQGFKRDPALVHEFYNQRRAKLKEVEPNAAHRALARLERHWDGGFLLVTQNIDDLHERGGSKNIAHMHGELRRICCVSCTHDELTDEATSVETACPKCTLPMRPDVVWFGEMPYYLPQIEQVLDRADIFISVGTSGQVMPASLFGAAVRMANPNAQVIEINPKPTGDSAFNRVIDQPATIGVVDIVEELIDRYGKPFVKMAAEGLAELHEIDDFISRWHDSPFTADRTLAEFLGMTDAQYASWVSDPDVLQQLVEESKAVSI